MSQQRISSEARSLIEIWLSEGLAKGYEDGTFRPDQPVTRAEFVAFMNRVFELADRSDIVFPDTPRGSWYLEDMQRVYAAGAITGFPDGTFRPYQVISRQEAAVMLYRYWTGGQSETAAVPPVRIPDLGHAASWSQEAIRALAVSGMIPADEAFRPSDKLTRAELVVLLDRFYTEKERLRPSDIPSLFTETFEDKRIVGRQIVDARQQAVWEFNEIAQQTYVIADGALQLGGSRTMQLARLNGLDASQMDSYAMEFTVNIRRMGNEGHSGRPMVMIIPRTKDASYSRYYAVTYHMEPTAMGGNLFRTKWSIINTNAPSGMTSLASGSYLLRENVDYIARLVIENTEDGAVRIEFYIDGPTSPASGYTPVVSYTDLSPYRITRSAAGPAFAMNGLGKDSWGEIPTIRYDDLRVLSLEAYRKWEKWLKRYSAVEPVDVKGHPLEGEMKYLINRGLMDVQAGGRLYPDQSIREAEFADMLEAWSGKPTSGVQDAALTKKKAAEMIYEVLGRPDTDMRYRGILAKGTTETPDRASHHAFEKGILSLEASGLFEPNRLVKRSEAALMLLRLMDEGYRLPHGNIRLPSILFYRSVLQRDKPITIWGTGTSGDTITVRFRQQTKQTTVVDGRWSVVLDPEPYGGPDTLSVSGIAEQFIVTDVLVGDVFVIAGESNAEMPISDVNDTEDIYQKYANRTNLRYYFPDKVMAVSPRFDSGGSWTYAHPWSIDSSPALGTFFVNKLLELDESLGEVPIGIIRATYGGSSIEVFMPDSYYASIGYEQRHDEPILSGYWNGFIHPIAPYAVRGILYYQGENSTRMGYAYESYLHDLIRTWREEFHDPDLPFILVQLAGYGENYYETDADSWPIIREIQMRVANTVPGTALVTAVDLADPDPLVTLPRNKRPLAERAAYRAMELMYGDVGYRETRSPEMRDYLLKDGAFTIRFDHADEGLVLNWFSRDMRDSGFEILTESGSWVPAKAQLSADRSQVIVWREDVSEPLGVRYAWRNWPSVTLFDTSGLPVLPFNSTRDVKHLPPRYGTDEQYIRVNHHMLNSYDGIVNLTRGGQFRMVETVDGDVLRHQYPIDGQSPGDEIILLSRLSNGYAFGGTNERIVHMPGHGLKEGDWIRNNTRGWIASRVARVLDANAFELATPIPGQSEGDELERYANKRTVTALDADD